ncbi:hypothetical protein OF83DRAFT_1086706 [Amylostereum chailletii]|nr:hypothetical protein OF83DRAFT_1086706 [Amylostereum chailletii]
MSALPTVHMGLSLRHNVQDPTYHRFWSRSEMDKINSTRPDPPDKQRDASSNQGSERSVNQKEQALARAKEQLESLNVLLDARTSAWIASQERCVNQSVNLAQMAQMCAERDQLLARAERRNQELGALLESRASELLDLEGQRDARSAVQAKIGTRIAKVVHLVFKTSEVLGKQKNACTVDSPNRSNGGRFNSWTMQRKHTVTGSYPESGRVLCTTGLGMVRTVNDSEPSRSIGCTHPAPGAQ